MSNKKLNVIHLNTVDSTNNYAKALLKSGEPLPACTVVYAECQTSGKGRLSRSWYSEEKNTLCMSLIIPCVHKPQVTLLSALGVHKALLKLGIENLRIKWPNDIISGNKKLCGILTEGTEQGTVIGIGLNLNTTLFPSDIKDKATSLKLLTARDYSPEDVLRVVSEEVFSLLEETDYSLTENALSDYNILCGNIDKEVLWDKDKKGICTGIDKEGNLLVTTQEGTEKISFGEVTVTGIY